LCYDLLRFSLCSGICAASRVIFPYRKSCRVCCHDLSPPKLLLHTQFTTSCVFDAKRVNHAHVHLCIYSLLFPLYETTKFLSCRLVTIGTEIRGYWGLLNPGSLLLNLSGLLHSGTFRPIRLGSTPGYLCMGRLHLCKFACRCVGVSAWDACTCISLRIDVWAYGGKRPLLSYGPFHIRAGSAIAGVMFVLALAMLEMARCGRAG